jgi:hypothetical protein
MPQQLGYGDPPCETITIKYEIYLFIIDVKTSHSLILGVLFIFQFNLSFGTEKNTGR